MNRKVSIKEDRYYYGIETELQVATDPERAKLGDTVASGGGGGVTENGGDLISLMAGYGWMGLKMDESSVGEMLDFGGSWRFNILHVDPDTWLALVNHKRVFAAQNINAYSTTNALSWLNISYKSDLATWLSSWPADMQRRVKEVQLKNAYINTTGTLTYQTGMDKVFLLDYGALFDEYPVGGLNEAADPVNPANRTVPNVKIDPAVLANSLDGSILWAMFWTRSSRASTSERAVFSVVYKENYAGGLVFPNEGLSYGGTGPIPCAFIDLGMIR